MSLRFKEVAKRNNLELGKLAEKAGISYPSFNKRMKNPTFETLKEMAILFHCEIAELLPLGEDFMHIYDEKGEWQGIMRKLK